MADAPGDPSLPPTAVETFIYPEAAKIFRDRGIKIKGGDGHILLATCGEPGLIQVRARNMQQADPVGKGQFCFRVTGPTGRLDLELPAVYGAMGNDYAVTVNMVTSTEEKSYSLNKNAWTQVGETADPQGRDFTLLQIVAAK
ncbi:hypothetical protein [Streptomyces sp. MBT27]|uniref:hypothetical protein n=1 Tax=Streptomyces sp. MBT27 TaxID=1488356 RepID=UPI001F07FE82|nr:hypothetical protein [Streptomyces sp. MBT27]